LITRSNEEYGISVNLGSQFDELEKNSGMEIISYQPFILWGGYADTPKVTYYMALYKPDNWRLNSNHRDLNVYYVDAAGKTAFHTDTRKRTDFLINPSRNEASFHAMKCDPPGPRGVYENETWYRLERIYDHTETSGESIPVIDIARINLKERNFDD